jgi:hypothetical protein
VPSQLAKLRRSVYFKLKTPARRTANAAQDRKTSGKSLTCHGVDVAIAIEIRTCDREGVAKIGADTNESLREAAAAVVDKRHDLLRTVEQESRERNVEIAIAIEINQLHRRDSWSLLTDQRCAVLNRPRKPSAFISEHRHAPAADLVGDEIEVAIAINITSQDHARVAETPQKCAKAHTRRSLEAQRAGHAALIGEHVNTKSRVLGHRDINIAVTVKVAHRDALRITPHSGCGRAVFRNANQYFRRTEHASANARVHHKPRHIAAPRCHEVDQAVTIKICKLKPIGKSIGWKDLHHRECRGNSAAQDEQPPVGITSGNGDIETAVTVEIARAKHGRKEWFREEEVHRWRERQRCFIGARRRRKSAERRARAREWREPSKSPLHK